MTEDSDRSVRNDGYIFIKGYDYDETFESVANPLAALQLWKNGTIAINVSSEDRSFSRDIFRGSPAEIESVSADSDLTMSFKLRNGQTLVLKLLPYTNDNSSLADQATFMKYTHNETEYADLEKRALIFWLAYLNERGVAVEYEGVKHESTVDPAQYVAAGSTANPYPLMPQSHNIALKLIIAAAVLLILASIAGAIYIFVANPFFKPDPDFVGYHNPTLNTETSKRQTLYLSEFESGKKEYRYDALYTNAITVAQRHQKTTDKPVECTPVEGTDVAPSNCVEKKFDNGIYTITENTKNNRPESTEIVGLIGETRIDIMIMPDRYEEFEGYDWTIYFDGLKPVDWSTIDFVKSSAKAHFTP